MLAFDENSTGYPVAIVPVTLAGITGFEVVLDGRGGLGIRTEHDIDEDPPGIRPSPRKRPKT